MIILSFPNILLINLVHMFPALTSTISYLLWKTELFLNASQSGRAQNTKTVFNSGSTRCLVTTPLLKFSKFSAKEKHLSSNFYKRKKKKRNSRDNKFLRSIFHLGFSHLFFLLFLLASLKSFKYIDSQNLEKEIEFTGTSQISFLFSYCPPFFTASSLLMQNWNSLNDAKVKMGIVGPSV